MTSSFPAIGDVRCIVMEGADARRFAQAQFSGDVDALAPGHWQWNAWLTAQGRVRALMHLVDPGDGVLLAILRGGDAEAIRAELARYRLRMRVSLSARNFTGRRGDPVPVGAATTEGGAVVLGYGNRSLRLASLTSASPAPVAQQAWRLADIRHGWPTLPVGEPEFLPPALGLERLGAVAFDKGCYPGQEIAARLHYRGGHKRRLCRLHGPAPLPIGEVRDNTGTTVAWVLDAVSGEEGVEALAVVCLYSSNKINIMDNIYTIDSRLDA